MSQKRGFSEHFERNLPVAAAAASQVPKPGPSLPNTLPYSPHGFAAAGAASGSLFPPTLPPYFRLNAPFPSLPGPPNFPFPPVGHFSTQPPRSSQKSSMNTVLLDDDDQVQRARAEAKAAKAHEGRGVYPNAQKAPSRDSTGQPGTRRSRIPSNKAPRKMPLSADGHPPSIARRNTPAQRPTEKSKPNQRRSPKKSVQNAKFSKKNVSGPKRGSSYHLTTSGSDSKRGTAGPSKSAFATRQDIPALDHPYFAPSTSRNQHTVLDTEKEAKLSPSSNGARGTAGSSSPAFEPPQVPSQPQPALPSKDPRPRYSYPTPEALHGVRTALGPDNWNEYLALMEDLWTGDISGEEFAAGTKRICVFPDDRIRKRMNNLMALQIVVPHLAQLAPDGGEGRREDVETALANAP